jgi:hypothetical protein
MSILKIPASEYHATRNFITNSKLADFRERGPLFFKRAYIDGSIPKEETKAMIFGSAFDEMFFDFRDTPEAFENKYAIRPEGLLFTTKEGKAWRDAQEQAGKTIITHAEHMCMKRMLASVMESPVARPFVEGAETQVTLTMKTSLFEDYLVAGRPDAIHLERECIWDLKTTADLNNWYDWADTESPRNGAPVWKYGYHRQGAIYQKLAVQNDVRLPDFFLIVVEKVEPFRTVVFQPDPSYLDLGWNAVHRDLSNLADCIKQDRWPNSPASILGLSPAQWMEIKEARELSDTL